MTPNAVGSWDDKDFSEGGFFDNRDGTITDAKCVTFDYQGKGEAVCALFIEITPDDAESADDKRNEYYRIGGLDRFTPSANGESYLPVGATTSMNKQSKAALFLQALKKNGFNLGALATGISALKGLHCHFSIVPMPPVKQADGSMRETKILIATKIYDEPAASQAGAAKKPAAKKPGASTAAAPAAAAASAGGDVDPAAADLLTGLIMEVLAEKGGKAAKTLIPPKVFKATQDAALRKKVMELLGNVAWLGAGADARGFNLSGGELSFPE